MTVRQPTPVIDDVDTLNKRQGARIRKARKRAEMTILDLALAVEVTPGAVSQWELGTYSPRQHHQIKIARVLGMSWADLFDPDTEAVA